MNISREDLIKKICKFLNLPFTSGKKKFSKEDLMKIYTFISIKDKANKEIKNAR